MSGLSIARKWESNFCWEPIIIAIFTVALYLPGLGARDFWAPGEPIYGEIIRVMYQKNNWAVPMVNGHLYPDKPVLYFWLALIISEIAGGVSEWTVRLPAALGGVGLVLATYQFGKTFYDRQTGLISGLVLATTSRLLWESRFLRLDTVLAFFLFLGFYLYLTALTKERAERNYLLAYLCFALATLTKGPVGLALPGLAILALIACLGQWRRIKEMQLFSGVVVLALVIAPWLGLLHLRGEEQWLRDFIWTHNIRRYALDPLGHIRPFYYYFVNWPPDFLPWTLFAPGALLFYFPWREKLRYPPTLALVCWFFAIFVFFSISKSKIAYYLLPLLPAPSILVGCYLKTLITKNQHEAIHWRLTTGFLYVLILSLAVVGILLPFTVYKLERGLFFWALPLAGVLAGGSVGMYIFLRRKHLEKLVFALLAVFIGAALIASVGILPHLDKYKSPRAIGEVVRSQVPSDAPVYIFQSTMADFNYYAGREQIPVLASAGDVGKVAVSGRDVYLIINDRDLKEIESGAKFTVVTEHPVGERNWYLLKFSKLAS